MKEFERILSRPLHALTGYDFENFLREDPFRVCTHDLIIFKFRNKNKFKFSLFLCRYTQLHYWERSKGGPHNIMMSSWAGPHFIKYLPGPSQIKAKDIFRKLPCSLGEDVGNSLVCRTKVLNPQAPPWHVQLPRARPELAKECLRQPVS